MFRSKHILSNLNSSLILLGKCSLESDKSRYHHQINCMLFARNNYGNTPNHRRGVSTSISLTPEKVTEILATNEVFLGTSQLLPAFIKSVECNQLASNNPIEDRLRVSSIHYPGLSEPTLFMGVFDGHGGGTAADIVCRRLFNYIAISLHPDLRKLDVSNRLSGSLIDLHNSPKLNNDPRLQTIEKEMLDAYRSELLSSINNHKEVESATGDDIAAKLKASFQRCDDDLSQEIQENLISRSSLSRQALIHYSYAAVSGCCAIVMVIHQGFAYIASSGDCRAVLGIFDPSKQPLIDSEQDLDTKLSGRHIHPKACSFKAIDLNDEHNCDNINEVRRLSASHPKSEQNTMIKHNRLLGSLMPFRAFGDFQYKWTSDIIKACGLTRTFQYFRVIPEHYETPPYLITEPDVRIIKIESNNTLVVDGKHFDDQQASECQERYIVMASDGLWELFESSRDVIETIVDHTINANRDGNEEDYDENSATYLLRSALRYGPHQDIGLDQERLRQLYHVRLQSTLTLPKTVTRNYRDDISIVLLKL